MDEVKIVYCGFLRCPIKDCIKHVSKIKGRKDEEVSMVNLSGICQDYRKYCSDKNGASR